jgi:hypothetical protein
MKIKQLLLAFVFLMSVNQTTAQLSAVSYKSDDFAQFRASKTCFIKTGVASFDNKAIAALEANWKITPFSVIEPSEVAAKIADKSLSFISVILIGEETKGYHYLALFNGGKKKIKNYTYDNMIAYSPINRWVDEAELTDCGWRVTNMLESMIKGIDIVQQQDIKGNSLDIVNGLRTYYNKRAKDIPKRTLLVSETSMGRKFKKEVIMGNYPFKLEVCPRSKIEKAIAEKSTEYYYLQPGITLNKSWFVVDPSNGDIMYFNYDMQGMTITDKNVKEMVEDIKK